MTSCGVCRSYLVEDFFGVCAVSFGDLVWMWGRFKHLQGVGDSSLSVTGFVATRPDVATNKTFTMKHLTEGV